MNINCNYTNKITPNKQAQRPVTFAANQDCFVKTAPVKEKVSFLGMLVSQMKEKAVAFRGKTVEEQLQIYSDLRQRYKPEKIKCLLIAESPPFSGDEMRFFYNPDVSRKDYLLRETMKVLFPDFKDNYNGKNKGEYLEKFKEKGFYLIDSINFPVNDRSDALRNKALKEQVPLKLKEIENLIDKDTPIILIKKNIHDIYYDELSSKGYNVLNEKALPFPCAGQQGNFKTYFSKITKDL